MDLIENHTQKVISINAINFKSITMLETIELPSVIKCLPKSWKEHTYTENDFFSFNCQQKRDIETKLKSKAVYKCIVQKIIATPSSENFFKSNLNTNSEDFEQYTVSHLIKPSTPN